MAFPATHFVSVDRDDKRVRVYKRRRLSNKWKFLRSYACAIGAAGYETPKGLYTVIGKSLDPDWKMPDSDWVAPEDRGKTIPGGHPDNPLKEAFIAIWDGVGLHGTDDIDSIGKEASHGCIRLSREDILNIYDRVPLGTLVYIF
jgi:lipoprotein-anchoring transpeptidase ErfK/SrfK